MKSPLGVFIFIGLMLVLDFYFFQAVKVVSQNLTPKAKTIVYVIYWGITILAIAGFLLFVFSDYNFLGKKIRTYLFALIIGLFFAKLVALVFFLVDDLRRSIQWLAGKLLFNNTEIDTMGDNGISRSVFLSWLGITAGGTLFGTFINGFSNKYNYHIKRVKLSFDNLPKAFKGLRIVHISDIHSGSLMDLPAVQHGVNMILNEKADLILFTGDLVNDKATEMKDFMPIFSQLKAPMGVFSTLGNHDYGDYVKWPIDGVSKEQNLINLQKVHADLGWRLLMNEHVALKKDGDEIALLGIENWGAKARFPKYGKMNLAYTGTEKYAFKILMSHDPSHWDAEVKPKYGDIDLMLSGHTHGMQFGIEIPGFKWSPIQYVYKQWGGLYEDVKQKLYVNRGFGFLGYPGRVGVLPEITVIELV
ncbi:MAG: metallophosphoesterase [Ferruginibacter sp.]|nr:metallophosphoesterase [Ferruginibacter sp.]